MKLSRAFVLISFFYLLFCFDFYAQKINISLPKDANKEYAFVLNKGIRQDTIQQGKLSFVGGTVIRIPEKEKEYAGIGTLFIKGGQSINLILNKENFSLTQGSDMGFVFKNSPENEYLYTAIQGGTPAKPDKAMYAPYFVDILRFMVDLDNINRNPSADPALKNNIHFYALNNLDVDKLYTSGIWYNIVDGLTKLSPDERSFGQDMVHILKRVKSETVFEHFSDNLVTITDQYGWDDAFDIIIPYIAESGRIEVPTGKMYKAFALAKVRKGTVAPVIEGLNKPLGGDGHAKTLIVFYQPDCENCHVQMEDLLKNYIKFEQHNIRVVSISADQDKESFSKDEKRFPWSDKLCDFKGFAGRNFMNYGILGTPTFFLVDSDQKIIKRYARITDIMTYMEHGE